MLNTSTAYTHPSFRGVALRFVGHPQEADEDTEWSGYYNEDTGRAIVVMVGDDREHTVDAEDLTELPEDGYCPGCGQTGCHCYR